MELLYMTSRKYAGKAQFYNDFMDTGDEVRGLIRVSQSNVVAWVTKYELNDPSDLSLGSRVYVSDLNIPWNYHKIVDSDNTVTLLEWDLYGEHLLIGDDSGTVSIWSYKDFIFNDWTCVGRVNLLGENMIAGIFFHSGRKIGLNVDKRDSIQYYEKFHYVRYTPTVQVVGGAAMDGCLVVTSTGLVVANVMTGDASMPLVTSTESVSPVRYKISVVDIAYSKNGNLIVATSCGNHKMPIKCYEISIKYSSKKSCTLVSQPLAGFFLDSNSLDGHGQNWRISHIKFVVKDVTDSMVVVVNSNSGSVIQLWDFSENSGHISHVFNEASLSSDVFKTLNWKCLGSLTADSQVTSVCTPKSLMSSSPTAACYIMVALQNNKIKALSRSLKEELSYSLDMFWDMKDIRRAFSNICVADIDLSWMANVMLVSDNAGNFYIIQIPQAELNGPLTVSYAVTMLEYCLVSGFDFWDVAISLKPHMLETVCDRFNDNFMKQPPAFQQLEYGGFLSMKACLYRLTSNSSQRHSDLMSLLTLYSISVAFKSLLRPIDLSNASKGPGESLSLILTEPYSMDMNNVITNIEPKEFSVDPSLLLSLQQLIQWVAHLALNILGRVPEHHKGIGYDIVNDNHALNILREMLVIIRIWGFMKPTILPAFIRSGGNFDGLPTVYRLISRLVQCNQNNEMDENFIDECYSLQNQVLFPTLNLTTFEICDVASPAFYRQSLPLQFIFGVEPDSITYEMETFTLDGSVQTVQNTDIVRHVYLGDGNPHKVKQCNRCQGKTQIVNASKSVALRSWENRWIRSCLCGGKWRFIKTTRGPYSKNK